MPHRPFRFVQSGDFHLELPLGGVAEVPEHLRDVFLDSPYAAAQRVFDAVLAEEADFLILAGNVLNPQLTGPRGPLFLLEQFARLAERGIAVYWAGGEVDPPEAWPTIFPLPGNVHVFPLGATAEFVHLRGGAPLARVVGTSRAGDQPLRGAEFVADPGGLPTIAVAQGPLDTSLVAPSGAHYWALGGQHQRSTLATSPHLLHYAGTPQGRCPAEAGVHGCTLVLVDELGQARTNALPADAVRWAAERLVVDGDTLRPTLENLLCQRMNALLEAAPKMAHLISWTVAGEGPLIGQLRRGALAAELLAGLREQYGHSAVPAWSVSLEAEASLAVPPEWYEQETIRGDFLRAVRSMEMNPEEALDLESYLSEPQRAGTLAAAAVLSDNTVRQQVLREAALLGVDLLGGDPLSGNSSSGGGTQP